MKNGFLKSFHIGGGRRVQMKVKEITLIKIYRLIYSRFVLARDDSSLNEEAGRKL